MVGEVYECVLGPGDTLYTPPFWWHHVSTLHGDPDDGATVSGGGDGGDGGDGGSGDGGDGGGGGEVGGGGGGGEGGDGGEDGTEEEGGGGGRTSCPSMSLLLAFDPTAEESVHPCVDDD